MPWNDNSSGPKPGPKPGGKSGAKKPGPWGAPAGSDRGERGDRGDGGPSAPPPPRRPSGGGGVPPDFNRMARGLNDRLRGYFGGAGGHDAGGKALLAIGCGVLGLWLVTGFYKIQANERGVITTFGAYSGQSDNGLHYKAPWPIQAVQKVPVTSLNIINIGGTDDDPKTDESLMLTQDENIVDIKFSVQWRVADAKSYVFNLKDPNDAIKAVAESAMREVVGRTDLQPILTNGQDQIRTQTQQLMQRILDSYNAGVYIDEVQMRSNNPPKVMAAFREVAAAQQDADAKVNRARGEAAQKVQQALGYKAQVVQEAQGDAARFNQVYTQYKAAPAVTRQRLYIETMEDVLRRANKIVIDNHGASAPIVLSPDFFKPKSAMDNQPAAITVTPQGQVQGAGQ